MGERKEDDGMQVVGVDGCRSGWFAVSLSGSGAWKTNVYPDFAELWAAHRTASLILVDIPIGLRDEGPDERSCDREARRLLGHPRGSSVFPAPCRAALSASSHAEASRINRERSGRGLSIQSWGITPKIRQVDRLMLASTPDRGAIRRTVREVHPEVLFRALNGGHPLRHGKKYREGVRERLEILRRTDLRADAIVDDAHRRWLRREVARDDILDALAAALTAEGGPSGLETLPATPPVDAEGLRMEIVYRPDAGGG
ncbi:MAG: DUF429 domain-containing protein [Gemmatimonadales bacterium]|nr:MAG: DUF429 domain-containing protein [Gemmatimonadales bacterium]